MPKSGQLGTITQSGMFAGGMAPAGNTVLTVTGTNVNNTDPRNPVIIPTPGAPFFQQATGATDAVNSSVTTLTSVTVDAFTDYYMEIIFDGANTTDRVFLRRQIRAKRTAATPSVIVGGVGIIGNDANDAVFAGVIPALSATVTGNNVNFVMTNPASGSIAINWKMTILIYKF